MMATVKRRDPSLRASALLRLDLSDRIVFDDRVCQQSVAHFDEYTSSFFSAVGAKLNVNHLALADAFNALEPKSGEGACRCLTLRVEHAFFQRDYEARIEGLHGSLALPLTFDQARPARGHGIRVMDDAKAACHLVVRIKDAAKLASEAILIQFLSRFDVPKSA